MAEPVALTKEQHQAIALLADGMSQSETARRLSLSRMTVNRWCKKAGFASELQAEIARRETRLKEQLQKAADEVQDDTIAQMAADIQEFQQHLKTAYRARINRGLKLLQKVGQRFDDLPEEAIGVRDMAGLLMASDRLLEKGFEGWAESLSINDLLHRLEKGEI